MHCEVHLVVWCLTGYRIFKISSSIKGRKEDRMLEGGGNRKIRRKRKIRKRREKKKLSTLNECFSNDTTELKED